MIHAPAQVFNGKDEQIPVPTLLIDEDELMRQCQPDRSGSAITVRK